MADKTIKVRATRMGYHGHLREVGDEFEVLEQHFSSRWMKKVEPERKSGGAQSGRKSGGAQSGSGESQAE